MNLAQQQAAELRGFSAAEMDGRSQQQEIAKEQAEAKRKALEEVKQNLLKQALEPEALERLKRVALVKPEKAEAAGNYILQGRLDNDAVRRILETVSDTSQGGEQRVGKIQFLRRRKCSEDDDDQTD